MNQHHPPAAIHVLARTNIGRVRARNEDAMAVPGWRCSGERDAAHEQAFEPARGFGLVLADGMGGLPCGQHASATIVNAIAGHLDACTEAASLDTVRDGIRAALGELSATVRERPECAGMGATLAGVLVHGARAWHFNVGDSRVYLFREGELQQLSTDDRLGRHRLTHAIGGFSMREPADLHDGELTLRAGDRLLLCSDGLSDVVRDARIVSEMHAPLADCVNALIDAALEAGGPDNISIILADCA